MFNNKSREDRGKRIAAYFLACAALTFLAFLPWMFPAVAALTTITAVLGWLLLIVLLVIALMAMSDSDSSFGGSTYIYAPTTTYYPPATATAQPPTHEWGTWKVIGNYLFTIILLAGALYFLFLFSQDLSAAMKDMIKNSGSGSNSSNSRFKLPLASDEPPGYQGEISKNDPPPVYPGP